MYKCTWGQNEQAFGRNKLDALPMCSRMSPAECPHQIWVCSTWGKKKVNIFLNCKLIKLAQRTALLHGKHSLAPLQCHKVYSEGSAWYLLAQMQKLNCSLFSCDFSWPPSPHFPAFFHITCFFGSSPFLLTLPGTWRKRRSLAHCSVSGQEAAAGAHLLGRCHSGYKDAAPIVVLSLSSLLRASRVGAATGASWRSCDMAQRALEHAGFLLSSPLLFLMRSCPKR